MSESKEQLSPVTVTTDELTNKSTMASEEVTAFEAALQEHWPRVFKVLYRLVGERAEAEDLVVETFWQLYRRPPREEGNLGAWLYRVATNLGLNALRARNRRARYEDAAGHLDLHSNAAPDPAFEVERTELRERVREVLAGMSRRSARLLLMRHSGLSYAELAEVLNLAPGSIGTLLARAELEFEKRFRQLEGE